MPIQPAVLASPAEVTPKWLGDVLRACGHDVRVRSLRSEPVGTGQMAHNERFHLEYEGDAGGAPATVVGKFPSPNEESRASGARGGYRTEVKFYIELADQLAVRTPACCYGAIAPDDTTFTLILEDLAPARQGDQIAGASDEQIEAAVVNLAGLHAPRWGDPTLEDIDWMTLGLGDGAAAIVQMATPLFLERFEGRLSSEAADVMRGFAAGVERWIASSPGPATLVHGDYRLDNLMFATAAGGAAVAAVDWQTLGVGSGGKDLAYLLGNSSEPERRRAHETRMLETYRVSLADLGVDASAQDIQLAYRHGAFQGPFITILGCLAVAQSERGDAMFLAMAERSSAQIRDLDALDLIL